MKIILEAKREPLIIRVRLLKRRRREVKKDPKLGGQWKDPKLGGQWKNLKLGGQWKDPKLGRQWKNPKLGGQWKDPKLGGQWKDPKLGGRSDASEEVPMVTQLDEERWRLWEMAKANLEKAHKRYKDFADKSWRRWILKKGMKCGWTSRISSCPKVWTTSS